MPLTPAEKAARRAQAALEEGRRLHARNRQNDNKAQFEGMRAAFQVEKAKQVVHAASAAEQRQQETTSAASADKPAAEQLRPELSDDGEDPAYVAEQRQQATTTATSAAKPASMRRSRNVPPNEKKEASCDAEVQEGGG